MRHEIKTEKTEIGRGRREGEREKRGLSYEAVVQ